MTIRLKKKSYSQIVKNLIFRVAVLEVKVKNLEEKCK